MGESGGGAGKALKYRRMSDRPLDTTELCAFANTLADYARTVGQRYFRQPLSIDAKNDQTPVTIADREIERGMRDMIAEQYPRHGIFGEEFGAENTDSEWSWMLDPIDGTRSFITGTPTFGSLISVLENGEPILGIIDIPQQHERWLGGRGSATEMNGEPCTVSHCETLQGCRLVSTSPDMFTETERLGFKKLLTRTVFYRYGGDCYNYALLASGHLDLVVEADLQPYDYCALVPVVEGAGGCISDWQGNPLTVQSSGHVVAAATPALHRQTIALLAV